MTPPTVRRSPVRRAALMLVAALALTLGACGSDGADGGTADTTCVAPRDGAGAIGGSDTTLVGRSPDIEAQGGAAGAVAGDSGSNSAAGGAGGPEQDLADVDAGSGC